MPCRIEQEAFWAGGSGDACIGRSSGDELSASDFVFFAKALAQVREPCGCIEFGANIG